MPKGTPFYDITLDALWHNILVPQCEAEYSLKKIHNCAMLIIFFILGQRQT